LDIHVGEAIATEEERSAIDALLGPPSSRWDGGERSDGAEAHVAFGGRDARAKRHLLLPALHALNDRVGWISKGGLNYVCERLTIPPADAYGVASFYHMFSLKPRPKTVVYVCDDIACMCAHAEQLCEELDRQIGPAGTAVEGGSCVWLRSPCLGLCDKAPAALLLERGEPPRHQVLERTAPSVIRRVFDAIDVGSIRHSFFRAGARLLKPDMDLPAGDDRVPARFRFDRAALRRAFEIGPQRIIEEVTASKLMGRGGAAFPTGRKWEAVAREPERPHYVVCNADESEPGTFKDLALMEFRAPSLVEAMTIAAFAGGCERGFIYVRAEYPVALERLNAAIGRARAAGALGTNIMDSGFDFDIEIRRGAGAYICGEETALFNSIEGYRGEPRNKPPFPVQKGLFGKPTIVNNVETLVNVPDIMLDGGLEYAQVGTPESTGPKIFCLSGCVARPGLFEVPFGTTLRALIDMAGGVRAGRRLQAVLLGGAAGSFLTPDEIDVELSFEGVRKIKASLGSGVVMLFDETIDLQKIVARIARFFKDESCGQCVPCRVGTQRQDELMNRVAAGKAIGGKDQERTLLREIGMAMRDASICGLGQTASSAIESAVAKFDLFGSYRPA
jgi:NADH-quinone oxidoreductase subunit F